MPKPLYIVQQRRDAFELVEWHGSKTEAWNQKDTGAVPLTEAFRRARLLGKVT